MQAVILAGGLGTRLRSVAKGVPKAMVPVNGRPFLEYEVALLRKEGVDDLVVCLGHLGDSITRHFGDGSGFGVRMRYSEDGPKLLGPAGALRKAEKLLGDAFFVTYGDVYLRAPYSQMLERLMASGRSAMMGAYRNENRHGRSDLKVARGVVVGYDKTGKERLSWVNFGVTAMRKRALAGIPRGRVVEEEEFYNGLIKGGELLAFTVKRRPYEIGTPESLAEFSHYISRRGL